MRQSGIGRPYEVELEPVTLRWKESPSARPGIDYEVDLVGGPDLHWRKTFDVAQRAWLEERLFHVTENGRTVEFHCAREHEFTRAEQLFGALETLVKLANRNATTVSCES